MLFGALIFAGFGATSALRAASELKAARAELETAEARAKALEVEEARAALDAAAVHLRQARGKIRSLPLRAAGLVPYLGRSVRAADDLTAAAEEVIEGAGHALDAAELLPQQGRFTVRDGRLPKVDWRALEQTSFEAADAFGRAEVLARRAPATGVIGVIAEARAEILDGIVEAKDTALRLASGASILPDVLGENGARRHLVVIQNAAEARATGGAIEAVMLLRARDRDLDLISSDPDELALGAPDDLDRAHRLNRRPGFASAARRIASTYQQVTGARPDTVIAFDSDALAAIVRVAGAITVDGVRLDGDTLVPFLSHGIFERYPDELSQGVFLGRTSSAMWQRVTGGDLPMRQLLEQLGAAARAKHIQLWARDEAIQTVFEQLAVTGSAPPADGTPVVAVAANSIGVAELDWYARRTLRYRLDVAADGTADARLDVVLRNTAARGDLPASLRAKQPDGAIRHDVFASIGGPPERFRLSAAPKSADRHTIRHALRTTPGELRLLLWRAPGLRPDTIDVTITLPEGAEPRDLPDGMTVDGRMLTWTGRPETDQTLVIRY